MIARRARQCMISGVLAGFILLLAAPSRADWVELVPNGGFELGGTPLCNYWSCLPSEYNVSNWIRARGTYDWHDWPWRAANCPLSSFVVPPILSNRCAGLFLRDGSYCHDGTNNEKGVIEGMRVGLNSSLRKDRLYALTFKSYLTGSIHGADQKVHVRLCKYGPNWDASVGNVRLDYDVPLLASQANTWQQQRIEFTVPDTKDGEIGNLVFHGFEEDVDGYAYIDDVSLMEMDFCGGCAPALGPLTHGTVPNACIGNSENNFHLLVQNATEFDFRVYNRWGEGDQSEVYHFNSHDVGGLRDPGYPDWLFEWNGCFNDGSPLAVGVYVFVMTMRNCTDYEQVYGQTVTVIGHAYTPLLVMTETHNLAFDAEPTLTALPATTSVDKGATLQLSVSAAAGCALVYQWRKDGFPLVDGPSTTGSTVSGALTNTLSVSGTKPGDAGAYDVLVSCACSNGVVSTPIAVSVLGQGQVGGVAWYDVNGDGVWQPGPEGVRPGATLRLRYPDGHTASTTSALNGTYSFVGLLDGAYDVSERSVGKSIITSPIAPMLGRQAVLVSGENTTTGINFGATACATGTPCAEPPIGLVGWWTFDTVVGTGLPDLTGVGAALGASTVGVRAGVVRQAVQFVQLGSKLSVPHTSGLDLGTDDFTLMAWVLPPASDGNRSILRKDCSGATLGFDFYVQDRYLHLAYKDAAGTQDYSSALRLPPGTWSHVAAVVRHAPTPQVFFFVSTHLVSPTGIPMLSAQAVDNSCPLEIGTARWSAGDPLAIDEPAAIPRHLDGLGLEAPSGTSATDSLAIDEAAIVRRGLEGAEIFAISNAGSAGLCPMACHLPATMTVCRSSEPRALTFSVCNYGDQPGTYRWTPSDLDPQGECSGTMKIRSIVPNGGLVSVPSHECVKVTVRVEAETTSPWKASACLSVTLRDEATKRCVTSSGEVRTVPAFCFDPAELLAAAAPLPHVGPGNPTYLSVDLVRTGSRPEVLPIRFVAMSTDSAGLPAIGINGLPAGNSYPDSIGLEPGEGRTFTIALQSLRRDAMGVQQIVAYGDADEDGIEEQLASFAVVVDDTTGTTVDVPEAQITSGTGLSLLGNPARSGKAEIRMMLAKADWCDVSVFDASGRRVRQLASKFMVPGVTGLSWDGNDEHGSHVQCGVYFVRLRLRESGYVASKTLVMLR